jgi:DNA-binding NarL/FixJ family response regulator
MPPRKSRLRIVLATEQILFRDAVRSVMESEPDLEMVGEAAEGWQTIQECEWTRPDVLLLDAHIRSPSAVRTTAMVVNRVPECRVLILSSEDDQKSLLRTLVAGASGFLSKDSALDELIDAARAIHDGETHVPTHMVGPLLTEVIESNKRREDAVVKMIRLTRRERQVLALLADGGDNATIARKLVISPRTAKTHIQSVLSKLELHSRLEAAAFARRLGLSAELIGASQ